MGTNFYWRDRPCGSCGRFDDIHVGKRSAGWSFGFRAYRHELLNPNHPAWGHSHVSPFGVPIRSRADWRTVFTTRTGALFDEYGKQISDPVMWLDGLIPPTPVQQRSEDSWERRGTYAMIDEQREWRDVEGFRFYAGEFS